MAKPKVDNAGKPSVAEINDIKQSLIEIWRHARDKWQTWENFHDLKHPIKCEGDAEPIRLPWARGKVNNMIDTLITFNPKVHREPTGKGEEKKKRANDQEKFFQGALRRINTETIVTPPFRAAAQYISLLGDVKQILRWDKDNEKFPFIIECPHPARLLVPPMERQPSMCIELSSIYNWQLKKRFPKLSGLRDKPYDLLEMMIYQDPRWISIIVDQREAHSYRNGLGIVPCVHVFAGKGFERMPPGIESPGVGTKDQPNLGPRPEDLAEGILAGLEEIITGADTHMTATSWLAFTAAYRRKYTNLDAKSLAKAEQEAGPGGIVPTGDVTRPIAEQIKWEELPNMQPWVMQPLDIYKDAIDKMTFSGVVSGEKSPGVDTATQHAMQLESARMGFGMPLMQLNYMASMMVGYMAKMMKEQGATLTVDGITVSGEDFDGDYTFAVDFWNKGEAERMRLITIGLDMLKAGVIDEETFLQDYAGEENSTEIKKRLIVSKALKSEQVLGTVIEAAASEFKRRKGIAPAQVPELAAPVQAKPVAPLTPLPGGAQEIQGQVQGMTAVPGEDMGRVIPQ